jgi:3-hydroxyacyl-[acyl-carrier-protein] dehydratase
MEKLSFTREQIMEIQPHRDPIMLVDEITELVPGDYAIGKWYVRPDLDVLKGHFPGDPTLPGVYTMEASGQVSNIVIATMPEFAGKTGIFLGVNKARYYKKVRPGDTLETHSKLVAHREDKGILTMRSQVFVNGELVAEVEAASAMR